MFGGRCTNKEEGWRKGSARGTERMRGHQHTQTHADYKFKSHNAPCYQMYSLCKETNTIKGNPDKWSMRSFCGIVQEMFNINCSDYIKDFSPMLAYS